LTDTTAEQQTVQAGSPLTPDLEIEHIEVIPILAPLAREYRGSHYRMTERATTIVRIRTRGGVVGEAYGGDEVSALGSITNIIREEIAPRLIGMNVAAPHRCWEAAFPVTFDILRDRREGLVALACVDTAIWDALGKALGVPCRTLWGGYRESIPMIVIAGYYGTPVDAIPESIHELRGMGFAGVKFKVGGASPAEDAQRLEMARAAAGSDFILAMDANQGFTVAESLELCKRVSHLDIRWFEEPVRWQNDQRDLRDVRARGGIPVCAGQSEFSPSGCRDLMEQGSIDVCNFDASWSGGPTAWLRTAAIAHSYSVEMGHHEEPQVGSHLLASQMHGTYAECFHPDRDPFWWNLIANRPPLISGSMSLPLGPGLGWVLDDEYITRHRWSPRD
jgi:D-galactarolactone cycloisomerase